MDIRESHSKYRTCSLRKAKIISLAFCTTMVTGSAALACDTIAQDAQYCGDMLPGAQMISEVIYPDLVANYVLQTDPLITSVVVTMPYDRAIGSWDDILAMLRDQMMFMGSPPAAALTDDSYGPGAVDGLDSARVEVLGRHADGHVMKAFVIDTLPLQQSVLMIITSSETQDIVTQPLRDLHLGFLADFEVDQ